MADINLSSIVTFGPIDIGTIISVVIGAIIGIGVAIWQVRAQNKDKESDNKALLNTLFDRVKLEIKHNEEMCKLLEEQLHREDFGKFELWGPLISLTDSFMFGAYDNLVKTGLQRYLSPELQNDLYNYYRLLFIISHKIKRCEAQHRLYHPSFSYKNEIKITDVKTQLVTDLDMIKIHYQKVVDNIVTKQE